MYFQAAFFLFNCDYSKAGQSWLNKVYLTSCKFVKNRTSKMSFQAVTAETSWEISIFFLELFLCFLIYKFTFSEILFDASSSCYSEELIPN